MVLSFKTKLAASFVYLAVITFLFLLPGSAIPTVNWLSKIYFDKWVHFGFFAVLLLLWLWTLSPGKNGIVWLLAAATAYGLGVEIVQDQLVPNRAFDAGDWLADMAGSFAGFWLWNRYIKK